MIRSSSMTSLSALSSQEFREWRFGEELRPIGSVGQSIGSISHSRMKSEASMASSMASNCHSKDLNDGCSRRRMKAQFKRSVDWDSQSDVSSWPMFRRVLSDTDIVNLCNRRLRPGLHHRRSLICYSLGRNDEDFALPSPNSPEILKSSAMKDSDRRNLINDQGRVIASCDDGRLGISTGSSADSSSYYDSHDRICSSASSGSSEIPADSGSSQQNLSASSGSSGTSEIFADSGSSQQIGDRLDHGGKDKFGSRTSFGVPLVCNLKGCMPLSEDRDDPQPYFVERAKEETVVSAVPGGVQRGYRKVEISATEKHYQRAIQGDPQNSLLLHNYARFLYEVQKNMTKAEEYYERAILACPSDGEILAQYAKLIWEVYHDQERAALYFDRAIKASPDNCFILAAYASFLWSIDSCI